MNCRLTGVGRYILQLQAITNSIIINNYSSYPINQLQLNIVTTSQPIGFSLIYNNMFIIPSQTSPIIPTTNQSTPYKVVKQNTIPYEVSLLVNILINGIPTTPLNIPITLINSTNGQVTNLVATSIYDILNIRTSLQIGYTYVKNDVDYKWTIISIQLTLTDNN